MEIKEILFSVNTYDVDGDVVDYGVFLHFGDTTIRVCESVEEFTEIEKQISVIGDQLRRGYGY